MRVAVLVLGVAQRDGVLVAPEHEVWADGRPVPSARVIEIVENVTPDFLRADANVVRGMFAEVAPQEALKYQIHVQQETRQRQLTVRGMLAQPGTLVDECYQRQRGAVMAGASVEVINERTKLSEPQARSSFQFANERAVGVGQAQHETLAWLRLCDRDHALEDPRLQLEAFTVGPIPLDEVFIGVHRVKGAGRNVGVRVATAVDHVTLAVGKL